MGKIQIDMGFGSRDTRYMTFGIIMLNFASTCPKLADADEDENLQMDANVLQDERGRALLKDL